jgi:predicted dehydrogenase
MVRPDAGEMDDDAIMAWLKTSDWGRCAYHCGQDTPDHQVVALQFANGITADLTMTAFDTGRRIRIFGTQGILEGAMHADGREPWIALGKHTGEVSPLPIEEQNTDGYEGHGGGDYGLIEALPRFLSDTGSEPQFDFIEGHRIAFAAANAAGR